LVVTASLPSRLFLEHRKVTVNIALKCRLFSVAQIAGMLRGLQLASEAQLRERRFPSLYKSGVRYEGEPYGQEDWQVPSVTLRKGVGDCEDLAAWRAAELVVSGEDRGARAVVKLVRPGLVHCLVLRGNGQIEDPSAKLGMRTKGARAWMA
jgi:hypothetical protein